MDLVIVALVAERNESWGVSFGFFSGFEDLAIVEVEDCSPASRAGMEEYVGFRVSKINKIAVTSMEEAKAVVTDLRSGDAQTTVELTLGTFFASALRRLQIGDSKWQI